MDVGYPIRKLFMFTHGHKWSIPVNGSQICEKCNKVEIVPCNHVWSEINGNLQTCKKRGFVSRLPEEVCPPHKFGEIVDDKQTCKKCGEVKVLPCQHKIVNSEDKQRCSKCGETICNHFWEEVDMSYVGFSINDRGAKVWQARNFRMRCKECGEQKTINMP